MTPRVRGAVNWQGQISPWTSHELRPRWGDHVTGTRRGSSRPAQRWSVAGAAVVSVPFLVAGTAAAAVPDHRDHRPVPLSRLGVKHVIVIDLENESFGSTFGPGSPATYLNDTLLPKGELITKFFATGHVSLDNYISQVSGQAPNNITNSDCITNLTTFAGQYLDLTPGNLDPDQRRYPGQVDGQGCVMPASVQTIGNQLDAQRSRSKTPTWREYAEDMGNDPARDV